MLQKQENKLVVKKNFLQSLFVPNSFCQICYFSRFCILYVLYMKSSFSFVQVKTRNDAVIFKVFSLAWFECYSALYKCRNI